MGLTPFPFRGDEESSVEQSIIAQQRKTTERGIQDRQRHIFQEEFPYQQ